MKNYLSLIPISAKARKRQNRMTVLCITLAVFLVTGVFSMADMGVRMETGNAKRQHGNYHIALRGLPEEAAEELAARQDVAAVSVSESINTDIRLDYTVAGKKAGLIGSDESWLTDTFAYLSGGRFPADSGEAVLSENAKSVFGAEIGGRFTLHTPAGDFDYRISGFEDDGSAARYDALLVCLDRAAFEQVRAANGAASAPELFVRFRPLTQIRRAISEIQDQFSLEEGQLAENLVLIALSGFSENNVVLGMYGAAVFLFVLVLTAGVIMITGSLNSNVAQRTAFFGLLRCLGASKGQVMRLVRREALYWCRSAVPAGAALGTLGSWGICAALRAGVGGRFSGIPLFGLSLPGILCGVLVGLLTVLLAARSPARRAANVSPVMAVAGNTEAKAARPARLGPLKIETALGIRHAAASKKNLFLMTGSFALSILLFLSFSALLSWVHYALTPLRPSSPDLSVMSGDGSSTVPREWAEELGAMPGVKRTFGRAVQKLEAAWEGGAGSVFLVSLDDRQLNWAEKEDWTGDRLGLERVCREDKCVISVYTEGGPLQKGDRLQIGGETLEVACTATYTPFDGGGTPVLLCTEALFSRLAGETGYAVLDIQLTKDATEDQVAALRAAAGDFLLSDRRESNRETAATYWAFSLLVYGFLAMIAGITVCSIVNSISMSVSARIRQYGAMRSVGMSGRQLTGMITAETLTYALCGLVVGIAAGFPAHKKIYESFITAYFGAAWEVPVTAVLILTAFVACACAAAIYAPARRIRHMSITETINEL